MNQAAAEMSLRPAAAGVVRHHREELSWEALERQDWHLWILAILLMFVLGVSLLSFMFPSTFWFREELPLKAPQRAFVGFCVLLALALVYMLQRQATVRRLKRQLFEAQAAAAASEFRAAIQSFVALPGLGQFRDALSMEYRRASTSGSPLAMVLLGLPDSTREQLGYATGILRRMLRRGETLFRISDCELGAILPGMQLKDAAALAAQAEENLGAELPEVQMHLTVTSYPEEVTSFLELEGPLRGHAS